MYIISALCHGLHWCSVVPPSVAPRQPPRTRAAPMQPTNTSIVTKRVPYEKLGVLFPVEDRNS